MDIPPDYDIQPTEILTWNPQVALPAVGKLLVITLNILAQHLIDGELPAFPYLNSRH
jgi:hypothetical protein